MAPEPHPPAPSLTRRGGARGLVAPKETAWFAQALPSGAVHEVLDDRPERDAVEGVGRPLLRAGHCNPDGSLGDASSALNTRQRSSAVALGPAERSTYWRTRS